MPGAVPGTTTIGDPVFLPPITAPAEALSAVQGIGLS